MASLSSGDAEGLARASEAAGWLSAERQCRIRSDHRRLPGLGGGHKPEGPPRPRQIAGTEETFRCIDEGVACREASSSDDELVGPVHVGPGNGPPDALELDRGTGAGLVRLYRTSTTKGEAET